CCFSALKAQEIRYKGLSRMRFDRRRVGAAMALAGFTAKAAGWRPRKQQYGGGGRKPRGQDGQKNGNRSISGRVGGRPSSSNGPSRVCCSSNCASSPAEKGTRLAATLDIANTCRNRTAAACCDSVIVSPIRLVRNVPL